MRKYIFCFLLLPILSYPKSGNFKFLDWKQELDHDRQYCQKYHDHKNEKRFLDSTSRETKKTPKNKKSK